MIKLPLKKTYRVLEVVEKGERSFFPQRRFLYFFWKKLVQDGYEYLKEEFGTLEEANNFLYHQHIKDLNNVKEGEALRIKKKNDTTKSHSFNAVFYKLNKTDNE